MTGFLAAWHGLWFAWHGLWFAWHVWRAECAQRAAREFLDRASRHGSRADWHKERAR